MYTYVWSCVCGKGLKERNVWQREKPAADKQRERCANLATACRNPPLPPPFSPLSEFIIALCCTFFLRIYLFSSFFFRYSLLSLELFLLLLFLVHSFLVFCFQFFGPKGGNDGTAQTFVFSLVLRCVCSGIRVYTYEFRRSRIRRGTVLVVSFCWARCYPAAAALDFSTQTSPSSHFFFLAFHVQYIFACARPSIFENIFTCYLLCSSSSAFAT